MEVSTGETFLIDCFIVYGVTNYHISRILHHISFTSRVFVCTASPADECLLYCRAHKSTNYFQMGDKVIDGTSCTHDSFNKCVNGVCRPAGCDNILYSVSILGESA